MRLFAVCAACTVLATAPLPGQSVLDRPPNLDVGWVAPPGALQFDFLHRFSVSPAPERKVSNSPTFLLGVGLPHRLMAGFNYATNSDVALRYPNEWEFLGRWQALSSDVGAPLDVTLEGAYNLAARSMDGALGLGRAAGPLRLALEGRVLGDAYASGSTREALGAGGTVRLGRWLALAGDGARLFGAGDSRVAWGAGLQIALPYTPHTLSLQATNTTTGTLQGSSRSAGRVRYGFAFTIPLHLARYFAKTAQAAPPTSGEDTTRVAATDSLSGGVAAGRAPAGQPPAAAPGVAPTPAPAAPAPASNAGAPVSAPGNPAAPAAGGRTRPRDAAPEPAAPRARPATRTASVHNVAYLPSRLEIAPGTTVTWTNRDPVAHSIVADDGSFDSGLIPPGGSWRHTFSKPGRWSFHCTPHPFMRGVVTVR